MFGLFKKKPKPLRLLAQSEDDLLPLSALLQDAVLRGEDIQYDPKARALTVRMNRFCHDRDGGTALRAPCAVQIGSITAVKSRGFTMDKPPHGMALLRLACEPQDAPACVLSLVFAGKTQSELRLEVECIDILFMDLAAPHRARSTPQHPQT